MCNVENILRFPSIPGCGALSLTRRRRSTSSPELELPHCIKYHQDSKQTRYESNRSMNLYMLTTQMLSRTAILASKAPSMIASRGFRTSAARLSSPYHYPEGPRSNIPFNPLTKYFAVRYWGTMGTASECSNEDG